MYCYFCIAFFVNTHYNYKHKGDTLTKQRKKQMKAEIKKIKNEVFEKVVCNGLAIATIYPNWDGSVCVWVHFSATKNKISRSLALDWAMGVFQQNIKSIYKNAEKIMESWNGKIEEPKHFDEACDAMDVIESMG
tara:strand:- start:17 stop:418 length:402 start_codon:yes stop_codon:yes gene_type:complete